MRMHSIASLGGTPERSRVERRLVRAARALAGAVMLAGCAAQEGHLPRVSAVAEADGFKMLRPGASARACRGVFFGRRGGDGPLLGEAFARVLALDREADSLMNVSLRWRRTSLGLYTWACVEISGDLVRMVPTVLVPMGGEHEGH